MPTETPVIVNQEYLQDIADAIRAKNGSVTTYTPADMAAAINAIHTTPSISSYWTVSNSTNYAHNCSISVPSSLKSTSQITAIIWVNSTKKVLIYDRYAGAQCVNKSTSSYPNIAINLTQADTSFYGYGTSWGSASATVYKPAIDASNMLTNNNGVWTWKSLTSGSTFQLNVRGIKAITDSSGSTYSGTYQMWVLYQVIS